MVIANHHIFNYNNKMYVIDVEKMTANYIEEDTATALKNITADSNFQLELDIKTKLINLGLIIEEKQEKILEIEEHITPISCIALFITQECNLNCVYCYGNGGIYGSSGPITSDTACKAIDWLIEKSGEIKKLNITFFGGEPLMNFQLIKEVVENVRKIELKKEKIFTFSITTNLSLLDEEKLDFFKENKITPTVSFDGYKEIQDKQRPFKNGVGSSYDITLPKIKKLLSVIPDSVCRATLLSDTDPIKAREALREIGFSNIVITTASPLILEGEIKENKRKLSGILRMLESDAESFLNNIKKRDIDALMKQRREARYLFGLLGNFLNGLTKKFPCGAGTSYVAVSNSGDVFLCHRFVGTEDYKLGSVFKSNLERASYLKSPVKAIERCSECFAKYICASRCYYENKASTGSEFNPSEHNCKLMQRTMEVISYINSNLNTDDIYYLRNKKLISEKPINKNEILKEIKQKRQKIMKELEELGLRKEEFEEVTSGLSLEELKNKIFGKK